MIFREILFFLSSFNHFIMIGCLSGVSLQHGTETAHWPTEQCPYHTIEAPLVFLSSNYFCAVAIILGIVLLVFLCHIAFYSWAV